VTHHKRLAPTGK